MKNHFTFKKSIFWLLVTLSAFCVTEMTIAQSITNFTLINADSDTDLFDITDGSTINFQELPTSNLNVRANTSGTIGSIRFFLNGSVFQTESVAPYALAGDNAGNYDNWTPATGVNQIDAVVYSGSGAGGIPLDTVSITVNFVDQPIDIIVTDVSFINCPTSSLAVGDVIDLDVLITPANATNQNIAFTASDGTSVDFLSGEFTASAPGQITVTATSFSDGSVFDQCVITIINSQTDIDPYSTIQAEDFSVQNGIQLAGGGTRVGYINNNDYIRFDNVAFDRGPLSGLLRGSSKTQGGMVEFRTDSLDGPLLASTTISTTGGWSTFQNFTIDIVNPNDYANGTIFLGTRTLFLIFKGGSGFLFDIDEFIFNAADVLVTNVSFVNCPTAPLVVGDFIDLDVLITPANATNQTIAFTASDGTSVDFLSGEFTAAALGEITVTATSFSNGSAFDQCVITIIDSVSNDQTIQQLVLVDADSDLDIMSLQDGDTLNYFYLPSDNLNVRAETNPSSVGSVAFAYDGDDNFSTENMAPYALAGDTGGDYKPWTPSLGNHSLTVTPYSEANRGGDAGIATTVNFLVINQDTTTTPPDTVSAPPARISGELKKWHKVTLSFEGVATSESNTNNPFANYRLNVTFTNGSKTYTVPGFYAADGSAENTSANNGNIWQAHFTPDEAGTWSYSVSFRTGTDIAISNIPDAGSPTAFDGETGTFEITASDKTGRDFRNTGRLEYVGEHYLKFADSGDYFFKVGADAPENTFAYEDFDATPNKANRRKSWALHAGDFDINDATTYTWGGLQGDGGRANGRELLGAIKYLSDQGMNVFSFLTFSLDGDDDNVYPHLQIIPNATSWNDVHHDRFDVSKLAQWEKILEYADKRGVYIHFKTQETENDQLMDGGLLGRERKLYYRELVARFGHHLALNWNLGEENDIWQELNDPNNDNVKAYAQYIKDIDPYDHNIVIHTYPGQQDEVYEPLLGNDSELTGASIQTGIANIHQDVKKWVEESAQNGKKWIVANDEQGGANSGVTVDSGYPDNLLPEPRNQSDNRTAVRQNVLWGTLMAGGAGVEYYYGYQTGCDDLDCQDHRTRQSKWNDAKIALDFFNNYLQSTVTQMTNNNNLTSDANDYVFAKPGEVYTIYRPTGGSTNLDLSSTSGSFLVQWYDPRNGGSLQNGSVTSVNGGSTVSIGLPPSDTSNDWVAFITSQPTSPLRVLVYHETAGFRHGSINAGIQMVNDLGSSNNWTVEVSQTSDIFNTDNLNTADVVIWMNTSGNGLLTTQEQAAFENYIQNGGGFVGVHAATDTYRNGSWPWYNELVGAIVQTSPNHTSNNFNATMDVVGSHPAVDHLGTTWTKSEEYYYWELNGGFLFSGNIDLLRVRSTGSQSYDAARPVTWYKNYDGGRSFYTALGHNASDYTGNSNFITMMEEAILWAGGRSGASTFSRNGVDTETSNDNELEKSTDIVFYPNPVQDVLTIKIGNKASSTISIHDLNGRLIQELHSENTEITVDTRLLKTGIYLLEVNQGGNADRIRIFKE